MSPLDLSQRIARMSQNTPSQIEVETVMEALEALADSDSEAARGLMTELLPIASALYLHHVYDAICLWMDEQGFRHGESQSSPAKFE